MLMGMVLPPIPLDWENKYNVRWQKTINVNPSLSNTTKIRFYRRPQATIKEILSPIYRIESGSKVNSGVSQSFADIRLSQLETFAGDVKRVKVFRTSEGDISDYDLIQDILVESKELLSSYGLSGSVVGETGIFTQETLKNYWNTGSLKAELTSSRVESGLKLSGSGLFTYTQSLDIKSGNTYELNLDAFYSASTSSNLGIFLNQVTTSVENNVPVPLIVSSSIATLVGTQPTKNLLDTVIPFKIDRNYPSASLYFSQSNGEWHLGNVSLRLSQDTAFSPDEINFITTMPTVIGNETYNFKFEFYDVNNNYVPVAVTQSALFNGGNTNIGGTLLLISSSASSSLSQLNAVSSSISGTMTVYSSSASSSITVVSGSVNTLSGSVSSSISSLSASVSSSNSFILSSSLSKVQQLANGQYSGSFIGDTVIYSPVIGGQQGYISEKFQVGNTTPIILDARTSTRKIYIGGVNDTGSYNSGSTSVYMDSTGKFSLKDKLTWDGTTLNIDGNINIAGGSAATSINNINNSVSYINTATSSLNNSVSYINGATSSLQTQINTADDKIFTNALGRIVKTPSTGTQAGLYLGNTNLGYYNGTSWKTYMDNTGLFYLTGSANGNALLWDGANLTIRGTIKVGGGDEVTSTTISNAASALQSGQTGKSLGLTGGSVGGVTIAPTKIYVGTGDFGNPNTGFYVNSSGQMSLKDKLTWDGDTLTVTGKVVITDGNAATTSSLASGLSGKINTGGAATDVNNNVTTISGGKITANSISANQIAANTITANEISSLNFIGKTATFDTGAIGGWTIDGVNGLQKVSGNYILKLNSNAQRLSITQTNPIDSLDIVRIDASTTIPAIVASDTATIDYANAGQNVGGITGIDGSSDADFIDTGFVLGSGGVYQLQTGEFGIIGLIYANEEIGIESSAFPNITNVISDFVYQGSSYSEYNCYLRVRRFPTEADAVAQTNVDTVFGDKQILVAQVKYGKTGGVVYVDDKKIFGATVEAPGPGGINTGTGAANWYRVEIQQTWSSSGYNLDQFDSVSLNRPASQIQVRYGRVANGYSVLSPGGLQVYQGFRNYMNLSSPTATSGEASNFFLLKGKSQIIGSLDVSSGFSAANKQFKIQHPVNENKWLYHTSIEAPRADLIYRGKITLLNGRGSSSIDIDSRMTTGTFEILTKNPQLFLQNESGFDRVIGSIESGSINIISENVNSNDTISWMVIAERKDKEILNSPLYDSMGNYKPERYTTEYAEVLAEEHLQKIQSGSI
jgi:hypothetical protein